MPTILIAGGITKGVDFRPVREAVSRGTRLVLLIGQGAADIEKAWSPEVRMTSCGDLATAVRVAAREAKPGERVLLSPACASFDQFDNYVHREPLPRIVRELVRGRGKARRARRGRGDRILLLAVMTLLGLGSVTVWSSSHSVSAAYYGSSTHMLVNHLSKVLLGLVLLLVFARLDYRELLRRRLAIPLVGIAAGLLMLTLIPGFPLALTVKGATRWLKLGFMIIQPSEMAKLALVVYIASILSQGEGRIRDYKRGFVPVITVLGVFCALLMLQPNFGNVLCLTLITVTMLFLGGARLAHLGGSGMGAVPLIAFVAVQKPHVMRRMAVFLDPGGDVQGAGFQLHQSLVAVGSGGLLGRGPGGSRQADFFLPDCHTDFVFAVLGEELGLIGTLIVVALFGIVVWRGLAIARDSRDLFGRYLAAGVTAMIGIVAFLNIAVVLGLAPTTGLPLPFVSYGGSAMMTNLAGGHPAPSRRARTRRAGASWCDGRRDAGEPSAQSARVRVGDRRPRLPRHRARRGVARPALRRAASLRDRGGEARGAVDRARRLRGAADPRARARASAQPLVARLPLRARDRGVDVVRAARVLAP